MAHLTPGNPAPFEEVYQLETVDPVRGGAGGVANRQAQQLLNRTQYLKDQVMVIIQEIATIQAAAAALSNQDVLLQTAINTKQNLLSLGTSVVNAPADIDFNSYSTPGWTRIVPDPAALEYWSQEGSFPTWIHGPSANIGGVLEVIQVGGMTVQRYHSPRENQTYRRWKVDGLWSAWVQA